MKKMATSMDLLFKGPDVQGTDYHLYNYVIDMSNLTLLAS